ncbi:membrane protein [soil metagenome]
MNYRTAKLISIILHPVLMPTYALGLIFQLSNYLDYTTPPSVKFALFMIVIFNTLVMPVLISWLLLRRGLIKSFNMDKREERIVPFICNTVLMMVAYYMINRISVPKIFSMLLLGAAASVVIAILINLKWKVSIHMIGIGGITGMFFGLSTFLLIDLRFPILVSLLVAGLIGTARLCMGAHRPVQLYVGFFVGFCCEFFVLSI